jgi:hypothetical protein
VLFCGLADLTDVKEERICIKVAFKLGKTQAQIRKIHEEEFGDNALGVAQTYERFKRFKRGGRHSMIMMMMMNVLDDHRQEAR